MKDPSITEFWNSYDAVNAQVSFTVSKYLTFKVGASNIFGIIPFFEEGSTSERFKNAFTTDNASLRWTSYRENGLFLIHSSGIDQ